ncbi:MAG: hypothetical protein M1376_09995 [Planctomycetes bacterium]|nr:hypothetical protein [Planctomycetota bacterium]
MKRYTGQKALYEAISRSRAKAKRSNILERFLPEASRQEKPPVPEGLPPAELTETVPEPPVVEEPPRPVLERLREAVAVRGTATLRRLMKPEKAEVPPGIENADPPAPVGRIPMRWRLKPLQLNAGRIEISVSYHIAVAVALVVILVILAGFRLGQKFPAKAKIAAQTNALAGAAPENAATETVAGKAAPAGTQGTADPAGGTTQATGDNWIVLAKHRNRVDLEPVKEHFAKNGIALEICALDALRQWLGQNGLTAAGLPDGDGFLLVTSGAYHNPQNPDTDGYKMKQKIAAVGATYRAPKGRDPFTPRLFSDAYGMKISRVK